MISDPHMASNAYGFNPSSHWDVVLVLIFEDSTWRAPEMASIRAADLPFIVISKAYGDSYRANRTVTVRYKR